TTFRQADSLRAPRSDGPGRLASSGLARLPRAIWQAGNAAIGRLLGRQRGQPLEPQVRARMEQAYGTDFSDVRVHNNPAAQDTAGVLGVEAFTHGADIYLGRGAPATESAAGKKLLAHELAHVVQQRQAGAVNENQVSQPGDVFEGDADRAAQTASAGQAAHLATSGTPAAVQCQFREETGACRNEIQQVLGIDRSA